MPLDATPMSVPLHISRSVRGFSASLLRRSWLELCTDREEDWRAFLGLCADSFADTPSFKATHPSPGKRKRFTREYFKYVYKTELSDGRAGLACVKMMTGDTTSEVVYAMCATYNRKEPNKSDKSAMMEIDEVGAEENLKEDEWFEKNIHRKIRDVASILDVDFAYGNYHVTAARYHGLGLSKAYFHSARQLLYEDGLKRGLMQPNRPSFHYAFIDDVRLRRVQTAEYDQAEIMHLHLPNSRTAETICADDPKESQKPLAHFNCVFVLANELGSHTGIIPKLKRMLSTSSKL